MGLVVDDRHTGLRVDDDLTVSGALEVLADDGTIVLSDLSADAHAAPGGLLKLEIVHAVDELLHLIIIFGEVHAQVPSEVLELQCTSVEGNLHAAVLNLTGVDESVGIAAGGRGSQTDDLIARVLIVVSDVESHAIVEELHLQTELIGAGHRRLEVLVGLGIVVDHADGKARITVLCRSVVQRELIRIGVATHLCPRGAHLTKADDVLVLDEFREHHAARYRRIDVGVMVQGQGRTLVATQRALEIIGMLISQRGTAVE